MKSFKLWMLLAIILTGSVCAMAQMSPNLENGFKNWGSYEGSSLDTVNNLNGNQMLHAPVVPGYSQRGGLGSVQYLLYQTSKMYQVTCHNQTPSVAVCDWVLQWPGVGVEQSPTLTVQRTLNKNGSGTGTVTYSVYDYSLTTQDGASHKISGQDAIDTSGYHIEMSSPDSNGVMSTATVTDRHGHQSVAVFPDTTGVYCGAWGRNQLPDLSLGGGSIAPMIDDAPMGDLYCHQATVTTQVTDSNGNRLTSNPQGSDATLNPGVHLDTLGRTFPYLISGSAATGYSGCTGSRPTAFAMVFNYTAPNGSSQPVKLCLATFTIQTAFNVYGITEFQSPSLQLTTVVLADGTKWSFDYDNYGEMTFVGLPTGGSISYTWTTIAFPSCATYDGGVSRAVATRTVNDNNGHSDTWHYQWGTVVNGVIANTVTDPLGHDTVHTFTFRGGSNEGGCHFYETRTQTYQGTGGPRHLLKQVDTAYSGGDVNSVPVSIQTAVYPSGKVSLVTKTYDSGAGGTGFPFGNVITEKDYDWGQGAPGPLLRETDTTYQWQVNSAYLTAHLIDLPASVIVKDGSGNRVAETDYTYDEPAYLTASNITTQHVGPANAVRGNLTTVSKWLNTSNSFISAHTNWYDTGEPYQSIDALGHVTTHSYSSTFAGAYPTQTCNPLNHCVGANYDFATGVLTSFTDVNAQTSNFSYDFLWRMTNAQAPPDPANNSARAQTTLTYSAPNTYPLSIQRQKSVTNSLTDVATNFFDGLARGYHGQHATPSGAVTVNTTFDGLGHPSTVTNPFYSTSDPTYGVTQNQYDGLGRVTQTTKQDGSVSSVAYNVVPSISVSGDCTVATDEAGKQRRACSDGLGRLVEVDDPNPGAVATWAAASVAISGAEQPTPLPGAAGTGTVTLSGAEASGTNQVCTDPLPPRVPVCHSVTLWDSGTITVAVNSYSKSATYGQGSTAATLASVLASAFQNDGSSPVNAVASGASVTFTARIIGMATNYTITKSAATGDPNNFGSSSFGFTADSVNALSGGRDISTSPDSGTVTITVNGTAYPTSYGGSDTNATIATRLASAISAGSWANASAVGGAVTLTSKITGPGGDYSLAAAFTYDSAHFGHPSFTAASSTPALSGGYNANAIDNNPYVTLYQYDALGNLLRVDQKGSAPSDSSQWRTRLFTYNSLSQLLTAYNPESGTISYVYDADGELLQKTSPQANQTGPAATTISFCYDSLHRVKGKAYTAYSAQVCTGTTDPTLAVTYTYDVGTNAKGKLTSLTDQAGSGSYSYDVLGRMSSEQRTIAGVTKSLSYDYNLDGSIKTVHYPSGAAVTYTPDSAGRMLSAVDSTGVVSSDPCNGCPAPGPINYVTGATYGPDGAITGFINGNTGSFAGINNTFSYNQRLQPINMSASAPGQTVFSIGYDFHFGNGNNGNVWGITNYKDNTRNQSFTYDQLNRLTSAQNAGTNCATTTVNGKTEYWGNSYGYDAWGNLLAKTVTKCGAENLTLTALANNQLSGYSYDAAGNMTHDATSGLNYHYDVENRITGAGGFTYTYDGDGNRVEKSNGSTGTLYWYMTLGIVGESDLAGTMKSEYVFFGGERVARRDLVAPTGVFYYFSDHLKTASVITDSAGVIKSESDFYPWGGELQFINNDSNHYKFTGKERDSESGLDYFGARYYSNGLGRFISADWSATPIPVPYADFGDPQSLNLYTYVRNLPTTKLDSDGHDGDSFLDTLKKAFKTLIQPAMDAHESKASAPVDQSPNADPVTGASGRDVLQNTTDRVGDFTRPANDVLAAVDPQVAILQSTINKDPGGLALAAATPLIELKGLKALTAAKPAARLTQEGLEHIVSRHWATSGVEGVGKFEAGTSARSLKGMIQETVEHGVARPNTMGRPGQIIEHDLGRTIGTNSKGNLTTMMRVVIFLNTVKTGFPF